MGQTAKKSKLKTLLLSLTDHEDILAALSGSSYSLYVESEEESFFNRLKGVTFDVILVNARLTDLSKDFVHRLKDRFHLDKTPVVVISNSEDFPSYIHVVNGNADDYIVRPFETNELRVRIRRVLAKAHESEHAHSLTHLPNHVALRKNVEENIRSKTPFAVAWMDINNFQTYNELYGFLQGDSVLRALGMILSSVLRESCEAERINCGHMGSDDFLLIGPIDTIEKLSQKIVDEFEAMKCAFYSDKDLKRGYVIAKNRGGNINLIPLISLSVVIVSNENRQIYHIGQLAAIAREVRSYMSGQPGVRIMRDRREDFRGGVKKESQMAIAV